MSQYIFILVWIAAMFFLKSVMSGGYRVENILGKKEYRVSWGFAAFAFCPVVIMATFRGDMGDSYAYKTMFRNLPNTISGLLNYIPSVTKDKGFSALSGIIKCIFGSNDVVYFCVLASIQAIILVTIYRKYSTNYLLSIFLFIASTDYLSWMFNGVRQFAAVTIIFASTKFMLEKKWVPTILMILLASTMHQSALVMIPIVIIVQGKAWNKRTILFLSAALVAVTFVNQFTSILDNMMQETQYANMVNDWTLWGDDGTNVFRVLVYSVPTILSLIGLKYIHYENDPVINFCANMSIVSTGLYIISMFSWKKYCPDYQLIEWNESNFDINCNPYVKAAYEDKKWAFVSDYVRLYIVYNQGGVYLDTDVLLHNGIDELLKNSCWMASDDVRYISTGLGFGAEKGNWLIKAIMEAYEGYEYPSGTNVTRDTVVIEKQLSEWKKTDRTQLVNGIMLIGLKDYGKYATHLYTYTWADDEVRKKREADIMADKKKSSRTKVIWKIKTILRNPRFISFFDGVRGTKIDKVYTFIAYDLLDYGLLYFVQRLLRKIRK